MKKSIQIGYEQETIEKARLSCKKLAKVRKVLVIAMFVLVAIALILQAVSFIATNLWGILISFVIFIALVAIEIPIIITIIVLGIIINSKKKKYGFFVSRKDMNYRSIESLERIERLCDEVDIVLDNKKTKRRGLPLFVGVLIIIGCLLLAMLFVYVLIFNLGTVGLSAAGITSALAAIGGGMVGGIFAIGLIIALPPIIAGTIFFTIRELKFKSEKDSLYKEALKKHEAVLRALKEQRDEDAEKMEYLNELNIMLKRTIRELNEDRGVNEPTKA